MNYYTADLHFGHHNILALAKRPFEYVKQMEDELISRWNFKVSDQDDIYIVGDLFFHQDHPEQILKQLNGKKHLILGNHDETWLTDELKGYFVSIQAYMEIVDQNHTLFLCHYPMVSYPKQSRSYMIHGHIHNDTLFDYWPILLQRERILNAGTDIHEFAPVTLNELIKNNQLYKQKMKNSYPMHLLSVRFHLHALKQQQLTKDDLYDKITQALCPHNVTVYREGLYLIEDYSFSQDKLDAMRQSILKHPKWYSIIKNFDVVYVDQNGSYSYLAYLNKNTIYLK